MSEVKKRGLDGATTVGMKQAGFGPIMHLPIFSRRAQLLDYFSFQSFPKPRSTSTGLFLVEDHAATHEERDGTEVLLLK